MKTDQQETAFLGVRIRAFAEDGAFQARALAIPAPAVKAKLAALRPEFPSCSDGEILRLLCFCSDYLHTAGKMALSIEDLRARKDEAFPIAEELVRLSGPTGESPAFFFALDVRCIHAQTPPELSERAQALADALSPGLCAAFRCPVVLFEPASPNDFLSMHAQGQRLLDSPEPPENESAAAARSRARL